MKALYCESFGTGPVLVLLHGWAMHSAVWGDFAEHLANSFRVICIDLPGHGHSAGAKDFSLETISRKVFNSVPEQPCFWLGWSLGATVMLDIAQRFPDKVKALIVLAGNPHFTQAPDWPGMDKALLIQFSANLQLNPAAVLQNFLALQVTGMPRARPALKQLRQLYAAAPEADVETLRQGLRLLREADLRGVLRNLQVPLQIILGAEDTLVPLAAGAAMQKLQPASQLQSIPLAGHMPFLSHAQQVVDMITEFTGIKY